MIDSNLLVRHLFRGRHLVIATMHGKESVIAPLLEEEIKVVCHTTQGFDTNRYGTFSGDIQRVGTAPETARAKAMGALADTGGTLAVASEGSFGPHPSCFLIPANEEYVCLVDAENDLFITGRHFTEDTNFATQKISSLEELEEICIRVGYPEHGLLMRPTDESHSAVTLSASRDVLHSQVMPWLEKGQELTVETDMRAMRNPTRMKAIGFAVEDLIRNLHSFCPMCHTPGFSIIGVLRGLPCRLCRRQTRSVIAYKYGCTKCLYEKVYKKKGAAYEDAMYCDYCNP